MDFICVIYMNLEVEARPKNKIPLRRFSYYDLQWLFFYHGLSQNNAIILPENIDAVH